MNLPPFLQRSEWEKQVPVASLSAFRIVFGAIMCVGALRYFSNGWLIKFFVTPPFHFKYFLFEWIVEPNLLCLRLITAAAALGAAGVMLGLFYRLSALLLFCSFSYIELLDVTNYLNHHYLAGLLMLLLLFMPAERTFSIDACLARRRGRPLPTQVSQLHIYVLRAQLICVYFYAGLAKVNPDWLLHAQPLTIWLRSRIELPLVGPLLGHAWAPWLFSWGGCFYDLTIWAFLLNRRTRPLSYLVALVFHAFTRVLFNIGLFPWIMSGSTLIFFSANWPIIAGHWCKAKWSRSREIINETPKTALVDAQPQRPFRGWQLALVAVYLLVQFTLPLRHHLHPGSVLWNEEGMRFSWRVMIREKSASVNFVVLGKESGRKREVSPLHFVNRRQLAEAGGQPDLLLQLAHHIGEQMQERWGEKVQVFARTALSFNGRRSRNFIKSNVDLMTIKDTLWPLDLVHPGPFSEPALP